MGGGEIYKKHIYCVGEWGGGVLLLKLCLKKQSFNIELGSGGGEKHIYCVGEWGGVTLKFPHVSWGVGVR